MLMVLESSFFTSTFFVFNPSKILLMSGEEGPLLEGPDISGRGRLAVCSGPLDTGANPDLPLTPWLDLRLP